MAIPFYNEEQENEVEQAEGESEKSLLNQFVNVLIDFCEKINVVGSKDESGSGGRRRYKRRNRRSRRGLPHNEPTSSQQLYLPDIVTSHISKSNAYYPDTTNIPRSISPQSTSSSIIDDEPCSSSIKTSLTYCTHQRIGKSLRNIADQFEKDRSHQCTRRRRRRPAGNRHEYNSENTIKFKFAFQIVIQITMIGLDFAFSRTNR